MKNCSNPTCKQVNPQPFEAFYNNKSKKDGLTNECRCCVKYRQVKYRKNNPDKIRDTSKKYWNNNRQNLIKKNRQYYENNLDKCLRSRRDWYISNKAGHLEYQKQYRKDNAVRLLEAKKIYVIKNKEKCLQRRRKYINGRLNTDPLFKLCNNVRIRTRQAIKSKNFKKNKRTLDIVGCTIEELAIHLEKQFQPDMSWDNHGDWHIDHKIPLASANTEEEIYALCHYTNLQPLWAEDNLKKSDKIGE